MTHKNVKVILIPFAIVLMTIACVFAFAPNGLAAAFGAGRISSADEVLESDKIHSVIPADNAIEIKWYREQLDTEEKVALYDVMEAAIASVSTGVTIPNMTEEDVVECYYSVIYDHPEFFWLSRKYTYQVTFDGRYTSFDFEYLITDKEEIQSLLRDYELIADAIISGSYIEDKQAKMKFIYKWVGGNTNYQKNDHDQTMLGVFSDHKAVCAGYVQAVQYLWLRAGVPCVRVSGNSIEKDGSLSDESHTWLAAVPLDHLYFYDVTWDDQQNAYNMDSYYQVSQEEFDKTHIEESDKSPREDNNRNDAKKVVEMAVKISTGEHLKMPVIVSSSCED